MLIERVRIRDYRNIAKAEIEPPAGINLIFGANAQGKTNLLDALHFATYIKSARATREKEIVRIGAERARVEVWLKKSGELTNHLSVTVSGIKKFLKLDGNAVTRFEDAIGILGAHFFFPSDLSLIKGDPSLRREALDYEVLKAVPSAVRPYADFKRALLQRNSLLKRFGAENAKEISAWTDKMVKAGVEIARMRSNLLERIKPRFVIHYGRISNEPDPVTIKYFCSFSNDVGGIAKEALQKSYSERIYEVAEKERELQYTTIGPHRDELLFQLGGESLRRYGSQGQQRSAVLAFKIALCDVARELTGDDPVLFLDDALSELDDSRKKSLLSALENRSQVFISLASEKELKLVAPKASTVWMVNKGKISPAKP